MPLGHTPQFRSSRFAGMLAGIACAVLWSTAGCGHSEGRDSKPTTITLGNEAAVVEPATQSAESKNVDAAIVPASNELKTDVADAKPTEKLNVAEATAAAPDPEATRTFSVEGPESAIRISFDDFDLLKVMNLDPVPADAVEKLPKWLKALDGKRIRVRGFMYPPFQDSGIRGFVLARDNQICCFGRTPKEYDLVDTFLRKGATTNYIQNRPFDVVGIFRIKSEIEKFTAMYELEDAIVIEK